MALEARIFDPADFGMRLKIFGNGLRVLHVTVNAQVEGFEPEQGLPCVERRLAGAEITQNLHTCFDRKRGKSRGGDGGIYESVIRRIGRVEILKLAVAPIVIAAVHDDTANGCAVARDELGGRVGDHVRAIFERAEKIRSGKGVVDEQDQFVLVRNFRYFFKREDGDIGIAESLTVNNFRVWLNGASKFFGSLGSTKVTLIPSLGRV